MSRNPDAGSGPDLATVDTNGAAPRWWQALNPPIYLISILPGAAVLITADPGPEQLRLVLPATLAVVLLQHAINLFNDAADWRLGADSEKWDSWVRYHRQRTSTAKLHGAISLLAGGLLGLATLVDAQRLWLLGVAAPLILIGYRYNAGERPLSYTHLGEWITGLCYGGVYGCLWLLTGSAIDSAAVAGIIAFGVLSMTLLLSHQPPQIDSDRAVGKQSFAVRYGVVATQRSVRRLWWLFLISWGLAQWQAGVGAVILVTYCAAVLLVYRLDTVSPPRVLMPATALIALGLLLRAVL